MNRAIGISFSPESLKKIDIIQDEYLLDRSNVIRVILENITTKEFGRLLQKQITATRQKRMVKMKLNYKSK